MPRDPEHLAPPAPAPPAAAGAGDAPLYTGWLSGAAGRLTRRAAPLPSTPPLLTST